MEAVKPKRTLVEETYDILIDAICSGELPPGARLNQDEIATKLNVSRQPVNSAISILKANGLVESTGRRSVIVTRFDPDLFRSIYEYRKVIEPFAVLLAGKSIQDADKRHADKVLRTGKKAYRSGKLRDLLQADMLFHEMIYGWSSNQVIQASMKTNWHHIQRSMAEVLRGPEIVLLVWDQHAEIVELLFEGKIEGARKLMVDHIEGPYKAIVEELKVSQDGE
jgi:DNA-binding GntR family transcriptional regulator